MTEQVEPEVAMREFSQRIETRKELREVLDQPFDAVTAKTLDHLDEHCNTFIRKCRFLLLATADAKGNFDVSPKGDPEGFVRILDDRTIAIPDRPGNNRADSIENILENPNVGLICLVPGEKMTLRMSGTAIVVQDQPLLDSMKVGDKAPQLAIVVTIHEAFFHCSKCMVRSDMWKPENWPDRSGLPTLARTMIDAANADMPYEEGDAHVQWDEENRLY